MLLVFADGVFAAIDDGHIVAEKMHVGLVKSAIMSAAHGLLVYELVDFGEMRALDAGPLKILSKQFGDDAIVGADALCPLAFHLDEVLRGLLVGGCPMR